MSKRSQRAVRSAPNKTGALKRFGVFARDNLLSWLASAVIGAALTVALFHYTSAPTRSAEVRARLTQIARERLAHELASPVAQTTLDDFRTESLDLSAASSYVTFGTAQTVKGSLCRFLMVFEPSSQSLIDKLVGRPGFYDLGYWAVIPDVSSTEILETKIEVADIDRDGNKDIFVYLESTFADGKARGLLVLKKDKGDVWHLMGLPSLTERMHLVASGRWPAPGDTHAATEPKMFFASRAFKAGAEKRVLKEYAAWDLDEAVWDAKGSTGNVKFSMIRNGTKLALFDNKLTGYKHLGVLANVNDGEWVLGSHHIMVSFLRIAGDRLEFDPQWNWGYPMLSVDVEDGRAWKLSEFHDVGTSVHVVDGTAFSSTSFGIADDGD